MPPQKDLGIDLTGGRGDGMIDLSPPAGGHSKGLIIMTTYTTRALATEVIGDDGKAATRTLRKFLRDRAVEAGGAVGIDTPGKGGRYALDFTKPQLRKLIKDFGAWQVAQEEAKAARAALLADKATETPEEPIEDEAPEAPEGDTEAEGPSDEEIAAMLSDEEEIDIED
jgi:hypothetical protein